MLPKPQAQGPLHLAAPTSAKTPRPLPPQDGEADPAHQVLPRRTIQLLLGLCYVKPGNNDSDSHNGDDVNRNDNDEG